VGEKGKGKVSVRIIVAYVRIMTTEPPVTPERAAMGGLHYRRLNSEECDGVYRDALANLPKGNPQDPSVVSDSCQSLQHRLFISLARTLLKST
jgi:hypothetical protein